MTINGDIVRNIESGSIAQSGTPGRFITAGRVASTLIRMLALGILLFGILPGQVVGQEIDGRCEVLLPDADLTRSAVIGPSVNCQLQCFFEQATEFCIVDLETGEQTCTPGDPTEVWQSFPVDDCEAEPIIRRLGGVPRNSLDADLKAALDKLEAQAIADTIAFHELPATDIGRVKRVAAGDAVRRGQVLGRVGNSGNTLAPHLHLHVMDAPSGLVANGLPYVFDRYRITGIDLAGTADFDHAEATGEPATITSVNPPSEHENELPLDLTVVDWLND